MKQTYKKTHTTINEDGSISKIEQDMVQKIPGEPDFVKMYLKENDLSRITAGEFKVLIYLIQMLGFDNKVHLPLGIRRNMCHDLGFYKQGAIGVGGVVLLEGEDGKAQISLSSLNTIIYNICRKDLMVKVDTGTYMINPHYFARNRWAAVNDMRKNYNRLVQKFQDQQANKTEAQKKRDENLEKGRNRIR